MHSPEAILPGGAEAELSRRGSMRVDVGEWKIDEDPAHLPGRDVAAIQTRERLLGEPAAIGTLKIRHLIHRHRRLGRALGSCIERGCFSLCSERSGDDKERRDGEPCPSSPAEPSPPPN